jgi:hypothetical protein
LFGRWRWEELYGERSGGVVRLIDHGQGIVEGVCMLGSAGLAENRVKRSVCIKEY